MLIRDIEPADNAPLASIVRGALAEFGANKPGTVFFDPTTDHLYELFRTPGSKYFVAVDGELLGGAGIFPSAGLPPDTCELCKMYLRPDARGRGLGGALIRRCLDAARAAGYTKVYIESMPELSQALAVYERFGFKYLDGPLGDTGHFGCDRWMLLEL
ncbi:MAG TPA: GNAT family N-acetyltransferase [Dinghuibacter sp.]|jgi:putative acetyltransferase|uniref:GNAT family N-acetyltransferase n=1 Tax=Dinghuibacter sp. TaxID=2024697 RepID=UPI002B5B8C0E|nr:GNAT family N-acetyltransferase [Dinghuibacter sp.]HTJ11534.1 GNAT family N-acetyltransferase [Dinghuibacter sp.]